MSNLTDYAEKLVLDWLLTGDAVTRPPALYVALFSSATDDTGAGTELVGNGYARELVTVSSASSPGGTTSNSNDLLFEATGVDWDTITHMGIYDAVSGGNLLWQGAVTEPTLITVGQIFVFIVGSIDFTLG